MNSSFQIFSNFFSWWLIFIEKEIIRASYFWSTPSTRFILLKQNLIAQYEPSRLYFCTPVSGWFMFNIKHDRKLSQVIAQCEPSLTLWVSRMKHQSQSSYVPNCAEIVLFYLIKTFAQSFLKFCMTTKEFSIKLSNIQHSWIALS